MTQDYYGTKRVTAWPESKLISHPLGIGETKEGYAVKYEDGHISWSPKDVFEKHYQPLNKLGFNHAFEAMKQNHRVSRPSWNGKSIWLAQLLSKDWGGKIVHPAYEPYEFEVCIVTKTPENRIVFWEPSQIDLVAQDWYLVE